MKRSIFHNPTKMLLLTITCLILLIVTTIILDFTHSIFQDSRFYLSESVLFSCFWILFLPLPHLTKWLLELHHKIYLKIFLVFLIIVCHLLLYPALIWMVSKFFFTHTFDYWQSLKFGISNYFIKTAVIYTFSLLVFYFHKEKEVQTSLPQKSDTHKRARVNSILITENNYKKILLQVDDILYFYSNTPYIDIYHSNKKYLHNDTLKSLESKLDETQFIRIHKSCIVNIDKISHFVSRQNGDYDITLFNNSVLRVSRNYAKKFKYYFNHRHHLTID